MKAEGRSALDAYIYVRCLLRLGPWFGLGTILSALAGLFVNYRASLDVAASPAAATSLPTAAFLVILGFNLMTYRPLRASSRIKRGVTLLIALVCLARLASGPIWGA